MGEQTTPTEPIPHNPRQGDAPSSDPDGQPPGISADGRLIIFASRATNLVADDTNECLSGWASLGGNCRDVFAYDRTTGQTWRVSVASDGSQANGESIAATLTPDGRYVTFRSRADNLAPGFAEACASRDFPENCHGIYLHDLTTGETSLLVVVSDNGGKGGSSYLSISPDGRFITFLSVESSLVDEIGMGLTNYFLYDRENDNIVPLPDSLPPDGTCPPPESLTDNQLESFPCFWSLRFSG